MQTFFFYQASKSFSRSIVHHKFYPFHSHAYNFLLYYRMRAGSFSVTHQYCIQHLFLFPFHATNCLCYRTMQARVFMSKVHSGLMLGVWVLFVSPEPASITLRMVQYRGRLPRQYILNTRGWAALFLGLQVCKRHRLTGKLNWWAARSVYLNSDRRKGKCAASNLGLLNCKNWTGLQMIYKRSGFVHVVAVLGGRLSGMSILGGFDCKVQKPCDTPWYSSIKAIQGISSLLLQGTTRNLNFHCKVVVIKTQAFLNHAIITKYQQHKEIQAGKDRYVCKQLLKKTLSTGKM